MPNPFTSKKILIAVSLMLVMCGIVLTFHFLSPHSQKISFPGATPQKGTSSEIITDCTPKFSHHFTDVDTIDSIVPPVFRNREGTMPTTLINTMGKTPSTCLRQENSPREHTTLNKGRNFICGKLMLAAE